MRKRKAAVVLVHGIGEQRPMDTLWNFVQAVWVEDAKLVHPTRREVWSKPELFTGSFDLRRVTTRESAGGQRFDFFEFYWAHHMQGHTLGGLFRWTLSLFFRLPWTVPRDLRLAWSGGWILILLGALLVIAAWNGEIAARLGAPIWLVGLAPILLPAASLALHWFVLSYAGDAARYLSAEPANVAIRQTVRSGGVALIEALTRSGDYDRLVLVGHSLGSVIAHDVLTFAWSRLDRAALEARHAQDSAAEAALAKLEAAACSLREAPEGMVGSARQVYRDAQRRYLATLAEGEPPLWIVSDLVTLGSPLSKAEVLIGRNPNDLKARIARRELPCAPPVLEGKGFSYVGQDGSRRPHHVAVFGPTVWTNVYHPTRLVWLGDIVSGPLRRLFGQGVLDVQLPIGSPAGFRHLSYWRRPDAQTAPKALLALRGALNLRGRSSEDTIWGTEAAAEEIVVVRLLGGEP